jgi:hypothetical protein
MSNKKGAKACHLMQCPSYLNMTNWVDIHGNSINDGWWRVRDVLQKI